MMTTDTNTNTETRAEREVAQFLAGQPSPEEIIAFRLSPETNARYYALVDAEREGLATEVERKELDTFLYLDHFMRLVKVEAYRRVAQRAS